MRFSESNSRFEFQSGGVAARITAPILFLAAAFHLAGAKDHEIARSDFRLLRFRGRVEIVIGDAVAVGQYSTPL